MACMVLITTVLWIAASAFAVLPGREREAGKLCGFAAVFTLASGLWALLGKGEIFADITTVVAQKWLLAAGCIGLTAIFAAVFAAFWERKVKNELTKNVVKQSQQKK